MAEIKQNVLIDGKAYVLEGNVDFSNMKITLVSPDPVPNPDPAPAPSEGVIKKGGWGGNYDPQTWKVTNMKNPTTQYKVVDDKGINIATNFSTDQTATLFIRYFRDGKHPFPPDGGGGDVPEPKPEPKPTPGPDNPPEPTPEGGNIDENGVQIQAKIKRQLVKGSTVERSVHNQSNEKNIKRDSIYGVPKTSKENVSNIATVFYINTKLSGKDQVDSKLLGGKHSDSDSKQGCCVPVGILIDPGKPSKGFLAKEYPEHPKTPSFPDKIQYNGLELPDLNGKTFGHQVITYMKGSDRVFEMYVDLSVLDTKISDLKEPPNKWQLYFTAIDDGKSLTGPVYTENQGIKNGGDAMLLYGRIDHVTDDTQVAFAGACEIEPKS